MSINSSMTVTGYYNLSPTQARGFVREADGSILNFDVAGAAWTEPESINSAGDITGFYELTAGVAQGFLRYVDGRIVTFVPPYRSPLFAPEALPVSINDFDEIAGNYPEPLQASSAFIRPREGYFDTFKADLGAAYGVVATAINGSGDVVGFIAEGDVGFSLHSADDVWTQLVVPAVPGAEHCVSQTMPDGINAGGTIAGWYSRYTANCVTSNRGGFVLSPAGVFTLFELPGTLLTSTLPTTFYNQQQSLTVPHVISIDQAGDIAGSYTDASGVQHGFVRNPYGTLTTFDPPEGNQTTSTAINDGGAITGFYHYSNTGTAAPVAFIRVP
jgi:hypothetical protein